MIKKNRRNKYQPHDSCPDFEKIPIPIVRNRKHIRMTNPLHLGVLNRARQGQGDRLLVVFSQRDEFGGIEES